MGGLDPGDLAVEAAAAAALASELALVVAAIVSAIESFDFGALPPEVNSARLTFGPGPAPLIATAGAYGAVSDALSAAASGSDGTTNVMAASWQSDAGDRAQGAFRRHAMWYDEQAATAAQTAVLATHAAAANAAARTAMPPLLAIVANRVASAALVASNHMGATTPAILANEAIYLGMWGQAANTMYAYQAASTSLVAALPPPSVAPSIAGDGGGSMPPGMFDNPDPPGGPPGPGPSHGGGGSGGGSNSGGGNSGGGDSGGGDSSTSNPTQSSNPVDPSQTASSGSDADHAISDVNQAMSSVTDSMADPGAGDSYLSEEQHGFYGTSPYSTTLAGLNGGTGSLVSLGMTRGGLGTMPGASTGFRMPANWSTGATRAFGALPTEPTAGPGPRRTLPRGAVAPKARMRRRRDDDEKKPSKVFVPGEPEEVPVLEKPPIVGVIEYTDGDRRDELVFEAVPAVGVIERSDDEPALATPERPR